MRTLYAGLIGLAVGVAAVADVAAQARVPVPARVTAPRAAGGAPAAVVAPPVRVIAPVIVPGPTPATGDSTPTQVFIHGRPTVAGVGTRPGMRGGAVATPENLQEIRIVTPGRPETRVFVREDSTAGRGAGPGMVGGAASVRSFARELRVIVEEDRGPGVPPARHETQIFVEQPSDVEVPIFILLE